MKKNLTDIKDLTPPEFRCGDVAVSCPALFMSGPDTYLIIGKAVPVNEHPELRQRIGSDETLIAIPAALVDAAIRGNQD
jgi:hypothetical protein